VVVLPEIIIQKALAEGFRSIKQDSRLIDVLYKNVPQKTLEQIRTYLMNVQVDCCFNYPRKDLQVPAIVILLKAESEAEQFLGDYMGDDVDQDMIYDTADGHGGSVSDLDGLQAAVLQEIATEGSSASEVFIDVDSLEEYLEVFPELVQGGHYQLYVTKGTGAGQVRDIASFTANSIDITEDFAVLLDSSSFVDIRKTGEVLTEGEPSRVFATNNFYERRGVHYKVQYQLQIIAGHQDEVIYLYSIVKALLLSQRPFLEGQGLMVFELAGSDLAPKSEYLPSDVFMRVLNMSFTYPFSYINVLSTPSTIQVNAQIDELGSPGAGEIVSVATFTLG
jgi:hypothetical protein